MNGPLYFLFFCSGLSGLIYQVVWVRVFGNVFGNTVYSASLVVAVFMLGLGVGGYVVGRVADRWYANRTVSLLRAYAYIELTIALMGLGIALLLPHLGRVSAMVSSYSLDATGWYVLSTTSYLARAAIAIVVLSPITLLMGGTLTLLIRHLVRSDLNIGGWRIAALYAVNTFGAAAGAFLTDFLLVPAVGVRATQLIAVAFNLIAGAGALYLARKVRLPSLPLRPGKHAPSARPSTSSGRAVEGPDPTYALALTALALAMSGFAAMGMEILWFRHLTILLGGFRSVFSLLLTVILLGIGAGSLLSGLLYRGRERSAQWLMVVQGLFVVSTLLGLALGDATTILQAVVGDPAYQAAVGSAGDAAGAAASGAPRMFAELWFNAKPILADVALPALMMGFSFPLANALVQRTEDAVGRRAGVLYLSNTAGAVGGSLVAGFLLLPAFGIQGSATILVTVAGLTSVPLYLLAARGESLASHRDGRDAPPARRDDREYREYLSKEQRSRRGWIARRMQPDFHHGLLGTRRPTRVFTGSIVATLGAVGLWLMLPSDYVIARALARPGESERRLSMREGVTEVIEVTEIPGLGRRLLTNGHSMSATTRLSQRYMRALVHIPLLTLDRPETVLVIGFGVGNSTHAATLHPSVRRVEVADLSKDILASASYFSDANGDVLHDPRVAVYVNDGRQHLQMQPPGSYDLVTLEPPPIGYAGVSALYSTEFYALARTRLKPKGYVSQWLPAYQVPEATTLAMIRAFIDVFPHAVLVSGAEADLLLLGTNDSQIDIDPARLSAALSSAPAVKADLVRVDLGSVREIVGTFVGSAQKLAGATRDVVPVGDDRPIQEYGVRSLLNFGEAVPASVVDLSQVAAWCPTCFADNRPVAVVEGLDSYLALLDLAYKAQVNEVSRARRLADREGRVVAGSAYLGAIVPESADVHNILGLALAEQGRVEDAIVEFREALRLDPGLASTHWHLGAALASRGGVAEAIEHLRRSVQLDPNNAQAQSDLDVVLTLDRRR